MSADHTARQYPKCAEDRHLCDELLQNVLHVPRCPHLQKQLPPRLLQECYTVVSQGHKRHGKPFESLSSISAPIVPDTLYP